MRPLIATLFASLLLASPVFAQEAGISGELEQSTTASPEEKAEFAASAVAEIAAAAKTVEDLLNAAENAKDRNEERIECLSRKVEPLRTLAGVSREASNQMMQYLAVNDTVRADWEYRKIAVALTKAREFLAEAQACVGDAGLERGESYATLTDGGENLVDESDVPPVDAVPEGPIATEQ